MHPHPVKQPNLTRKLPTDMPTGLMAASAELSPRAGRDAA